MKYASGKAITRQMSVATIPNHIERRKVGVYLLRAVMFSRVNAPEASVNE
jgi:hypothetical protein